MGVIDSFKPDIFLFSQRRLASIGKGNVLEMLVPLGRP